MDIHAIYQKSFQTSKNKLTHWCTKSNFYWNIWLKIIAIRLFSIILPYILWLASWTSCPVVKSDLLSLSFFLYFSSSLIMFSHLVLFFFAVSQFQFDFFLFILFLLDYKNGLNILILFQCRPGSLKLKHFYNHSRWIQYFWLSKTDEWLIVVSLVKKNNWFFFIFLIRPTLDRPEWRVVFTHKLAMRYSLSAQAFPDC